MLVHQLRELPYFAAKFAEVGVAPNVILLELYDEINGVRWRG